MIRAFLTAVAVFLVITCWGQSKQEQGIIKEGEILYKSEMASWYGTDIFLENFSERREYTGGYFSYLNDERVICVFFSQGDDPNVIATFSFDSTFNIDNAIVDGEEREFTDREMDLLSIRQVALNEYRSDTLFRSYEDMNPNFIPIIDDQGKRVYILTGPQKHEIVVFGNDYLLTFDAKNRLKRKKRIHNNIISLDYGTVDSTETLSTWHTHLPSTGDLITATDICTLMLYEKYAQWGQHFVLSDKNVSIWDCKKDQLTIITRKAWEKIYNHQNNQTGQ